MQVFHNRKEAKLLLQGNGEYDCNCTAPRGIIAIIILFIKLGLEHLVAIRNALGHSAFNPAERAMSAINFGL